MRQAFSARESKESNLSNEDFTDDLQRELSHLKRKVTLANGSLVQIANNPQKFAETLYELSQEGIRRIQAEQFEESLVYFEQSERILEYAASCGNTIDRNLIIAILHNQACAFQRIYDLPKLSNYLEALIYNLETSIQNSEANQQYFFSPEQDLIRGSMQEDILATFIKRKIYYSRYHLLYCALNSKIFEHQIAIKIARKSIQILTDVCRICHSYCARRQNPALSSDQANDVKNLFLSLSRLDSTLTISSYDGLLRKVKKLLGSRFLSTRSPEVKLIEESLSTFSIGKIMQIGPLSFEEAQQKLQLDQECSYTGVIRKALYLAAGYFSIGTQLRLLSSKSQSKCENFKSSDQFSLSEVYHLYSLLVVMEYVPFETVFLSHLLTSYNNHYSVELELRTRRNDSSANTAKAPILSSDSDISEGKGIKEQVLQCLPEQSEIQMEGQSRWSKSQLRSPSSENLSQKKIIRHSGELVSKKKKNKVGAEYKVMGRKEQEPHSTPNIQTDRVELKEVRRFKTERSTKKSNLQNNSKKKEKRSSQIRKQEKRSERKSEKKVKSKSKQKYNNHHCSSNFSDLLSPKKSKQNVKVVKIVKQKSKERTGSKENLLSKEKKYSKQKSRKGTVLVKVVTQTNLHTEVKVNSPQHNGMQRQFEKTIRKVGPKKSQDTKRKLKKTIK